MLAPVAPYPDDLLDQVLMASTYPLEVVEADRWVKANSALTGDALADALEGTALGPEREVARKQPDRVGDDVGEARLHAFIGQQDAVMATVQKLRAKADAQGSLKTPAEQLRRDERFHADRGAWVDDPVHRRGVLEP